MTTLSVQGVSKAFGGRRVLHAVSHVFAGGITTAVIGPNGSGKSTFVKVLAGLLRPDAGSIELHIDGHAVERVDIPYQCGYVAPYLSLYDEFTPMELLAMHASFHGALFKPAVCSELLDRIGLAGRGTSPVRTFSSGMRQRAALALAVSLDPAVLILDEPSTTLDEHGRAILAAEVQRATARGAIVIIATNDTREQQLCSHVITIA